MSQSISHYFFFSKWKTHWIINLYSKWNLLTLRLPSNSRNFTIPSRFRVCCAVDDDAIVSFEDPFVSAVDIVAFSVSTFCKIGFVAACLNSLLNWNNEKFRRLSVVNLKTFNMFQLILYVESICCCFVVVDFLRLTLFFSLALDLWSYCFTVQAWIFYA